MTLNVNEPNKNTLMFGLRTCAKKHTDINNRPIRRKTGSCWFCDCSMAPGQHNIDFGELPTQEYKYKIKHHTAEEKRQARIDAQMRWNKANPEKCNEYLKKYSEKDEIKKKASIRAAEYYQKNKETHNARQKAYYKLHREEILKTLKEKYQRKKDEHSRQEAERQGASSGSESMATELIQRIFGS